MRFGKLDIEPARCPAPREPPRPACISGEEEVLHEHCPDDFLLWWEGALGYARVEAEGGSPVAAESLRAYWSCEDPSPSPTHEVFRHFFFAFSGRRAASGRFVNRERLYELPEGFHVLLLPVSLGARPDHLPGGHAERRVQVGHPVARVAVRLPLRDPRP